MTSLDIRGTITGSVALAYKAPCLVATTSNITLNGAQTIDGVLVGNNSERILVLAQSDQTQNGIYNAATSDWTYATDWSNNNNISDGTQVIVTSGATNAGLVFVQTCADSPIVIGTSLITFVTLPPRFVLSTVIATGTTADFTNVQNAANGGGVVYLTPGATYNMGSNTLVLNVGGTVLDGGDTSTTLSFTNTSADNILIGNSGGLPGTPNVYLRNLTVLDAGTRVSGFAVELYGAERTGFEKVVINATGAQTAFWAHNFNDVFARDCRFYGTVILSGTGSPGTQLSDVFVFDHCLIQPNTRAAGLLWDGAVHTVRAFSLTILNSTIGLTISNNSHAATDHVPEYGEFYNLEIDGSSQQAIWVQGGIIFKFVAAELNNNQSTADVPTIQVDPDTGFSQTRDIQFIGGSANDGWGRAIVLDCADTSIIGMDTTGCSRGASGTHPAINITGTDNISIIGCKFRGSGSSVPSYGVQINGGAGGPFSLVGNNYYGCATGEVSDATTNAIIIGGVNKSGLSLNGTLFGSGPPGLTAPQGTIYMRTDGSSSSTRMYINTNGSTGWTNVVTAA